jgi:hypothetical protein
MEDFTFLSIGAASKTGGAIYNLPRSPGPCYMQGPSKKKKKPSENLKKGGQCTDRLRLVAGGRLQTDQWSATAGRGVVGCRQPLAAGSYACPPFLYPPCPLLPTSYIQIFCTCGQLFLIGFNTCPPCPDFS